MDLVFQPLSVRRGIREPIPLSEELPKRIWKYLDKWLTLADEQYTIRWQRYIMAAQYDEDSSFQRPDDLENIRIRA
ncbi:hypothetical protein [Rothia koreensis]|uniref:hypothetical protein n=1 Tax=Rothia koreensis TaxID=592378 RepID=UPI003FCDEF92